MKLIKLFSILALSSTVSTAWAGAHFVNEVAVSDTYLRGSLSSAKNSSDSKQYIGCYINSYSTNSAVVCMARNAQNVVKSCIDSSPNEATLNAVAAISDSAYVYAVIENGSCTRISIHSNSAFIQ